MAPTGTGAAPRVFADHVALPFKLGFSEVYKIFADAEAIYSYEGTYEINSFVTARAITGISAIV